MMPVGGLLGKLTPNWIQRGPEPSLTIDEAGVLIKNERRRMVVYALAETDQEKLTIGGVSETVAASECEKRPAQLQSKERKQVYVGLYQGHLPKMDKMGIIDYDQDRGTLECGPKFDSALHILEGVADKCVDANGGEVA